MNSGVFQDFLDNEFSISLGHIGERSSWIKDKVSCSWKSILLLMDLNTCDCACPEECIWYTDPNYIRCVILLNLIITSNSIKTSIWVISEKQRKNSRRDLSLTVKIFIVKWTRWRTICVIIVPYKTHDSSCWTNSLLVWDKHEVEVSDTKGIRIVKIDVICWIYTSHSITSIFQWHVHWWLCNICCWVGIVPHVTRTWVAVWCLQD